jgi:GntP family gluconate:H+ symporter
MNDSGFWVVARMSGFTEKEGLKAWTFLLAIISLVGLAQVLLLSWIFPLI